MTFTELTLSELERLVRAVQATRPEDPDMVRVVVGRMAADPALRHGRITVESVINMLDAWNGSTVPPETVQPVIAAVTPTVGTADAYQPVRALLQTDLITPEEIARAIGLPYTRTQLQAFAQSLPPADVIQWCADQHYFLVAGPHTALSPAEIFEIFPNIFPEENWQRYQGDLNGGNLNIITSWFAINLRPRELLKGKTYALQQKLIHPEYERPATMTTTAWVIAMVKKIRNIDLDADLRTKTSYHSHNFCYHLEGRAVRLQVISSDSKNSTVGLAVQCWPMPTARH